MTFSICVRERDGEGRARFGVAVTTRLPAVGTLCPFASEAGAVATQAKTNVDLGRRGLAYVEDGLGVGDALDALLAADDRREHRQLHGVDSEGSFAFTGEECLPWCGHVAGDSYTVAGNLLVGESVVDAVAEAYEAGASGDGESDAPLAERLVDALAAGQAEGGDKREELRVQSAALRVADPEDPDGYWNDLRVDASETPIADLLETYELAREGYEAAVERAEGEGGESGGENADGSGE